MGAVESDQSGRCLLQIGCLFKKAKANLEIRHMHWVGGGVKKIILGIL